MSGQIDETNFSKLKERRLSDQSELEDFSDKDTTYIAVVSLPRHNIEDIVDEVAPSLGMPEKPLTKFLARRSGYKSNSAIEDPHNEAYEELGLSAIYQQHLSDSDDAQNQVSDLVERVVSGENITLVCYEKEGDKCHRHILVDLIEKRVTSREECKFDLSA